MSGTTTGGGNDHRDVILIVDPKAGKCHGIFRGDLKRMHDKLDESDALRPVLAPLLPDADHPAA